MIVFCNLFHVIEKNSVGINNKFVKFIYCNLSIVTYHEKGFLAHISYYSCFTTVALPVLKYLRFCVLNFSKKISLIMGILGQAYEPQFRANINLVVKCN